MQIYKVDELWNIGRGQIWILLSLSSLSARLNQVYHCSLYSSWNLNLNIRVKVRVDANVDRRMNGWKTGSLSRAMLKANVIIKMYRLFRKMTILK